MSSAPGRWSASGPGPHRRTVLAAGLAAALGAGLAGCTADAEPDAEPAPSAPPPDPDDALRDSAAERERGLLREYEAVLAAVPALAARLAPVRAHHDAHLAALLETSSAPSASPSSSGPASGSPVPVVPVPADPAAALARLVAAERAAGTAHAEGCLAASRGLAGLLAALSASELSHPVALG